MIFLNQIPGISTSISKTLSSEFKSLNDFMTFLNNMSDKDKIEYLSNKEIMLNNNKTRKIGEKVAKKIITLLF